MDPDGSPPRHSAGSPENGDPLDEPLERGARGEPPPTESPPIGGLLRRSRQSLPLNVPALALLLAVLVAWGAAPEVSWTPERAEAFARPLLFTDMTDLDGASPHFASAQVSDDKPSRERAEPAERPYPGRRRDVDRQHLARYREITDRAIARGLRYLSEQQADSGHFSSKYSVAVTALGGMAMLGNGVTYGRGAYGYDVRQAVEYLTSPSLQLHNGFITEGDSTDTPSKMHGHTYAILFLSQVVGSLPDPQEDAKVRRVVAKGVKLIIDSQTARGGWGYEPGDEADEASLTVCALQALRAAKDAGFHVPPQTIRSAVRYLKDCCKADGSFRYSLTRGSQESTYELTAAAVSTLDAAGEYGMEEHGRGVEFLRKSLIDARSRKRNVIDAASGYPYYGNLYAGQVYFQLGGEIWESWSLEAWPELIRRQKPEGLWESRFGSEYATAVALLILEIPRGYLPIFER